jgi:hypothetical protein
VVSQALVTQKAQFGYGKVAQKVGLPCGHLRPVGGGDFGTLWPLPSINALFYPNKDLAFTTPSKYGAPQWLGLFDTSQTIVGDFLIEPNLGTFFIASQETFVPAYVISCNRVLTFTRPGAGPAGPGYYGGDVTDTESPLMTRWPAAVTQGTKGTEGSVKLPSDERLPWVQILIPAVSGVQIRSGDLAVDEQEIPQRYNVSSCELTSLGYRITAALLVT